MESPELLRLLALTEDCTKAALPLNPHPSIANYSSQSIAPLIDFFTPIVASLLPSYPTTITHCNLVMRYENNTPCNPADDIFVQHPECLGESYTGPDHPCSGDPKSPEMALYESYAKKSAALKIYMDTSPAKITYFNDICFI